MSMKMTFVFFFFSSRRRHTRFSRDWSSDVCSSDLDKVMVVPIQNVETFEFGTPATLSIHANEFAQLGPPAPGERFPALKAMSGGQAPPQEVILNWTGTLKQ